MSDKAKVWSSLGAAVLAVVVGVFAVEGGYSNNPADPGGETNHGVTVRVAREAGYQGPMRELPKEFAQEIYVRDYIERPNFHRVIELSPAVGEKLVDAGVNAGPGRSARWFQQSLNHLSRGGADFPPVAVDGQIGRQSLAAYEALERKRGRVKACELALKLIDVQQGAHYLGLNKPMFIVGWADNRLGNVPLARCADSVRGVQP
jgi:lysozyme family protein